jgi:hypothetical protein
MFLFLACLGIGATGFVIIGSILRRAPIESFWLALFIGIIIAIPVGALIVHGMYSLLAAQLEEKLVASDQEPAFVINADGVSGSVVMLEGPQRGRLRKCGMSRFSLRWDEIIEISFAPGVKRSPLMKITSNAAGQEGAIYYVARNKFLGRERHIIETLEAHGVPVSVKGALH